MQIADPFARGYFPATLDLAFDTKGCRCMTLSALACDHLWLTPLQLWTHHANKHNGDNNSIATPTTPHSDRMLHLGHY